MRRILLDAGGYALRFLRQNRNFFKFLDEFKELHAGSESDFSDWRDRRLHEIRSFAQRKTVAYSAVEDWSAFRMDKDFVRRQGRLLTSRSSWDLRRIKSKTSGTTGVGLEFYADSRALSAQAASWWLFRSFFGVTTADLGVVVGGRKVPLSSSGVGRWMHLRSLNQIYISAAHLSDEDMAEYVSVLNERDVRWLHGYPSALLLMAEYILRTGSKIVAPLLMVSTGSESISPAGREFLAKAFGVPVTEFYGMGEAVCSMWRCEKGNLHDLGVGGDLILDSREGFGDFQIVGSGYWNRTMPLLGYQTGDTLANVIRHCSCGRPFPIALEVEGRTDDYVLSSSGRKVGRLAKVFTHVSGCPEAQLAQMGVNRFELRLTKGGRVDARDFAAALSDIVGDRIEVDVVIVDDFKRTSSGKVRSVVREFEL